MNALRTQSTFAAEITPEAMSRMQMYEWPGNVRELENLIRRILVLGKERRIRVEDLPPEIAGVEPERRVKGSLAAYELEAIRTALVRAGGNRRSAAKILGIGESTLYRKLKELGLGSGKPHPDGGEGVDSREMA